VTLHTELPEISAHPYINSMNFSSRAGEAGKLVVDTVGPVRIENTAMRAAGKGYQLSVEFTLKQPDTIELVPDLAVVEATDYGRMEVKRSTAAPGQTVERWYSEARQLYSSREYAGADEKLMALLKQEPLHVPARLLYASALLERGNNNAALAVLGEGLSLNPGISEWANVQARILVSQGQVETAVEVLTRALPVVGSDNDYYAFYAALMQRLSRHPEASEIYRILVRQQPDNGLWWMGLAISQDAMKEPEDALYSYNRALAGQTLSQELREYVQQQIERLSG
jgi:MSHA biogenesis protein MshN